MNDRMLLNWLLYPVRRMIWREIARMMRKGGLL